MLLIEKLLFCITLTLCLVIQANSTEFVPVYILDNYKLGEDIPALSKISQESFTETLIELAKDDAYIIAFIEQTLSLEDLSSRSSSGESPFKNLAKLQNTNKVSYIPYVETPSKALKHLNKPITETSLASFKSNPIIPENNILVIDLNDASEDEERINMLSRHDQFIADTYEKIKKEHKNVLAIYTAHHNSWVNAEQILKYRTKRDANNGEYFGKSVFVYTKVNETDKAITVDETNKIVTINSDPQVTISWEVSEDGYWNVKELKEGDKVQPVEIVVPLGFSYHCSTLKLEKVVLTDFQFQAGNMNDSLAVFGDAYDCVGFTSIPIWSGIFVTFILLIILSLGITMMMDIKTMDRFDDPKGKTITISATE